VNNKIRRLKKTYRNSLALTSFSISVFLITDFNYKQMMRASKVFNYEFCLVVTGFVEVAAVTNVNADRSADIGAIRVWVSRLVTAAGIITFGI
jgi:hypothetical protein